jgi:hypothetical protein
MRRLALTAAVAAALVLASAAFAGGTITGTYTTTITGNTTLKGTWVLAFAKNGTYTVSENGHAVIRGTSTSTPVTVTFGHETGPLACTAGAKYTWKRNGKTLKLTRVKDTCPGRAAVLAHLFTQS